MTAIPADAEFAVKSEWADKPFKALCVQCGRAIHAGDSEAHAQRKAREHENVMAKYADADAADDPVHARVMNPEQSAHEVAVRFDI